MGRRWWNRLRKLTYASNHWHCQACGDFGEQIEAHEVYAFDLVEHVARFTDIVPLCHDCHMYIHWMATQGTERDNALKKGVGVLLRAGLKVPKIHIKALQMESKVPEFLCEEVYTLELMSSLWHSGWKLDVTEIQRFRVRPQWLKYKLRISGLMYLEEGDRCLVFPHRKFQSQ